MTTKNPLQEMLDRATEAASMAPVQVAALGQEEAGRFSQPSTRVASDYVANDDRRTRDWHRLKNLPLGS